MDLEKSWESYKEAASEMGLKPVRVLISEEKQTAYCQTEADSKDQVKDAHDKVGIPFAEIFEAREID